MRARPWAFVAQEQVALSTAPVWDGAEIAPRHLVLRAYATATARRTFAVMPGGLTRVSVAPDSLVVSMQRGGGSKDTWVRCEDEPAPLTLLRPAGARVELTRGGAELPSRVADNLFWLARYVERLEGLARLGREALARVTDETAGSAFALEPLLAALARHGGASTPLPPDEDALLAFLYDETSPRSLRATLGAVHQLASSLRDQISLDTWRTLLELQQQLGDEDAPAPNAAAVRQALNAMIVRLAAWNGLAMESMTRGLGFRFADLGRRIERAAWMATLLGECLVHAEDDEAPRLESLLEVADSSITYRRRYRGELQAVPVLDLLLTDETNPRGLVFQLVAIDDHVARLPERRGGAERSPEQRFALAALSRVRLADVRELCRVEDGKRLRLEELLARCTEDLRGFSDALTRSYLSHAGEARRVEHF